MMSFWKNKWGYKHSLLILGSLVANGFLIELFAFDRGLMAPVFPYSILLLLGFILVTILVCWYSPLSEAKSFFLSRQFIVSLITLFSILIMLSGYIPQRPIPHLPILQKLGIFNVTTSVPFVVLFILISFSLLLASLNRMIPFKVKNIPFLLNHIGILVVFIAAIVGSGEVKKIRLELERGNTVWQGYVADKPSIKMDMPFALKLNEFILQEYDSELAIIDKNYKIVFKCGTLTTDTKGKICNFKGRTIAIREYIKDGFKVQEKFVSVNHIGTSPIAHITVSDGNEVKTGTVVRGSSLTKTEYFHLNSDYRIAIPPQKPKSFKSIGRFYTQDGIVDNFSIEVNKPFEINGWKLYQYGYNEGMGKWSKTSTIEAVYDPSLIYIYIGAFLLILGSFFLMFPNRYIGGLDNE